MDALLVRHCRKFPQWKAEMEWGWNLLFYGVGSKLEVRRPAIPERSGRPVIKSAAVIPEGLIGCFR